MDAVWGLVGIARDATERAGALARALTELADEVRAAESRVRVTTSTPWRSVAADAFRSQTSSLAVGLEHAAGDLEASAADLRAHAAAAGGRLDAVARLAAVAERAAADGLDDLARRAAQSLERSLPLSWR